MRIIFFLLIFGIQGLYGQNIVRAIFAGCLFSDAPYECSDQRFKDDTEGLLSEDIVNELRKSPDSAYIHLTFAFISDHSGKILPESIETICDNKLLDTRIRRYIHSLPPFIPKNNDFSEFRTAHVLHYVLIYREDTGTYRIASKGELTNANIKPEERLVATPPVLKKHKNKTDAYERTKQEVYKIIKDKYRAYKFAGESRSVKLVAKYIIEKDGTLNIEDITCTEDNQEMIEEYRRVLNKLPKFIPANYKGVSVRVLYSLPIMLTFSD